MRKTFLLSIILVMWAGSAFAAYKGGEAGLTLDASVAVATETYGGSGAAVGAAVGASYDMQKLVKLEQGRILVRADVSSFMGSTSNIFGTLDSSRVPFFVGARYVLPFNTEPIELFAEAGLEVSMDKHEAFFPGLFAKYSVNQTNLGFSPGFGVSYPLGHNISIGADLRFHVISNSYESFMFSIGYTF